jgi:SAM-dependent methyltransferase
MSSLGVIWHDVECGGYADDLALWREVAGAVDGPVLDVGAGTGRVTLELAGRGIDMMALDSDAELLDALRERAAAAGVDVPTVCADARSFDVAPRRFGAVIVPMQTLQLFGGAAGRAAFLRCARSHLVPGGIVAAALADALESFDSESDGLPDPDLAEHDGVRYVSQALAVVDEGDAAAIHRLREVAGPGGARSESHDVIRLDRVSAEQLEDEARALGFTPQPARLIPASDVYVGSTVVVLRA